MVIYGSDEKEYHFLLKGSEDLRQDERVMQIFSLVNRLLNNTADTEQKEILITRYSVVPLSSNSGLIGWVSNCDTLHNLVRIYRNQNNISMMVEFHLQNSFCQHFELLPIINKLEIFQHVLSNTQGYDLKNILWANSPNSEIWLERRTTYIRTLATMSIVGYILGLGDRHPSNIMLQRKTGKIVHIDFGDCFEVAMKREKQPERVPFRLTRMLVNAMEPFGIHGNFKITCYLVMRVLRDNKESLMAILESFVYDPLVNWKLFPVSGEKENVIVKETAPENEEFASVLKNSTLVDRNQLYKDIKFKRRDVKNDQASVEQDNTRPLYVIKRIKKKLNGTDFNNKEPLEIKE